MIDVDKPGLYVMYDGKLMQCVGIINDKAVIMVGEEDCPHCGGTIKYENVQVISSPNFQNSAKPVPTISGGGTQE